MSFLFSLVIFIGANMIHASSSQEVIVIDVRTQEEFSESHVKNALHIDFLKSDFKEKISKLDKNKSYKLYCRSGNRSGKAQQIMQKLGFNSVENLGSLNEAAKQLNTECVGKKSC